MSPQQTFNGSGNGNGFAGWQANTRVFLQPIAAPSILGLFGFAAATFMVATNLAGWYGNPHTSGVYLFPFAAVFGGIAQFAAGMWSYRARDGLATAMHGMWGSFWIAYGILNLLVAVGDLHLPGGKFPELAFWFWPLAAITLSGAVASLAENLGLTATLSTLAVGAAFLGIGYLDGSTGWLKAGGWVLFASSVCAFYTASAMMMKGTFRRVILPLGKPTSAEANIPLSRDTHPLEYAHGEPGVRMGQ